MEIISKGPEPVEVEEYDFMFLGSVKGATVTLWPSKGDTVKTSEEGFVFTFPRLHSVQIVYSRHLLGVTITKGKRVFMDVDEIKKRQAERKRARAEADEIVHGKGESGETHP